MSIPRTRAIRLREIEVDGIKIDRQLLPEQFRAYCVICGWGGEWRSVWDTWEQLVIDIKDDLMRHLGEVHV